MRPGAASAIVSPMRVGVLLAAFATGALATVPAGTGATAIVAPVSDAYVTAAAPHRNFGTTSSLKVSERPISVAYLRFEVSVPPGETVTQATLQLSSPASAPGFTVHRVVSTTWNERAITYANVPPVQARAVASVRPRRGPGAVAVDVTPLVTRTGLVSLALKADSRAPLAFWSRESGRKGPHLLVETSAATTTSAATGPCGNGAPHGVEHVIWIWMENKAYDDVIGSSSAPFENQLAAECGLATNYHGVAHPSLPNYIAATSGGTQAIADDEPPSAHPLGVASLYSQVKAAGKTWRDYAEGAPGNCPLASSGQYAVKHDPAPYYTEIRGDCAAWDVPMGAPTSGNFASDLAAGTLPSFSFVTPDICNSTHDCGVSTGDAWLQGWFAKILPSPAYLSGKTVVFVVWDEDDGSASNRVPLIVVSPSTAAGTRSDSSFDHYSLLRTTEQLLGITTYLGSAGSATSMVTAFGLG
jgi:hypothetical protein